ncbi:hypothetical protein [Castellaniella sp.]|uniref:hypothetical protein n=1 Tax=Castellaniella sp. TaxID=1955812 RepID=UPI002AFFD490|nr:hypothetical protein [Castellaniella sp.]
MSWKHDLKVADLDSERQIEVTCRKCGKMRYERAGQLAMREDLDQAYLDQVEKILRCRDRFCKGPVRISLTHQKQMEGFVGGMA